MYKKYSDGWIEVITGPMFSGKSEELIRRVRVLQYANTKMLILKPALDSRGDSSKIISRNGSYMTTQLINNIEDIDTLLTPQHEAIVIDEVQFIKGDVATYCNAKANTGIKIIVSGLDQDYKGLSFGPIPRLLALAEFVTKLTAICLECNNAATMTYRKSKKGNLVQIGDSDTYEARCRSCHKKGMNNK